MYVHMFWRVILMIAQSGAMIDSLISRLMVVSSVVKKNRSHNDHRESFTRSKSVKKWKVQLTFPRLKLLP